MQQRPILAIIFDHDGTLVDSEPVHHAMWRNTLANYGVELSRRTYQTDLSGRPTIDSARRLVQKHQLSIEPEVLCQQKLDAIAAHLSHTPFPLIDGVLPMLTWLGQKPIPLAVASGASAHEVNHSLNAHGITGFFKAVATRNDVRHNKPAPDVYLHAAAQLGVAPEHCLAIEDSDSGQSAAVAANMRCLRLPSHTTLAPSPLCYAIDHIGEVQAWLQNTSQF